MKTLIALTLMLAGVANAFDFYPASDYTCGTYCTGYFTSDTNYVVDYANLQYAGAALGYKITVSVNGKTFAGYSPDTTTGGVLYNATFNSVTQQMESDGTFVTLSGVTSTYKRTCTRSGRGQHCTTWNWIVSGTVTP